MFFVINEQQDIYEFSLTATWVFKASIDKT